MSISVQRLTRPRMAFVALAVFTMAGFISGCKKENHGKPEFKISVVASGLENPMGIETEGAGNIWVTEPGNAKNDGKVVLIRPDGKMYDAIINLSAFLNPHSGEPQGTSHLLFDNGILYILSGNYLYKANISAFKPGDAPIDGSKLPYEDIGSFVLSYPFVNNTHDTHPYNLTKGPNGDIYIADAGANAIIHRKSAGSYSVVAEIPGFANPTPVGPPQVEAVPTGLIFDGQNFLVSTLTGFPFIAGKSNVYKVSLTGTVSVYQPGFTTAVDIAEGNKEGRVLLQYGSFGQTGFAPNSGALLFVNGSSTQVLSSTLNMPVALKQVNNNTWYITSMGDGTVLKATYY